MSTRTLGIHQSDLIIRSAIKEGLAQIRKDPSLLDWVFVGLAQDSLTIKEFGQKAMREAKDWFLKTGINVYHGLANAPPEFPCVTIVLQESSEAEKTLGDKHYDVSEPLDSYPIAVKSFSAEGFDPVGLVLTLPQTVIDEVYINTNMTVIDRAGQPHRILELSDTNDKQVIVEGPAADFSQASIRYAFPYRIQLESVQMRETYQLGVHVNGPPLYLMVLHSVVIFCLLRYKQSLLEERNFGETNISSSDFQRNPSMGAEAEYSRYISLSGTVKQFWPKDVIAPVLEVRTSGLQVIGGAKVPEEFGAPGDLLWSGDEDVFDEKLGG